MMRCFTANVVLMLLLSFSAQAHMPHEAPIDMRNPNGVSHTGFGNFGATDFEAMSRLRVNCLADDREGYQRTICNSRPGTSGEDMAEFFSTGAQSSFTLRLRNYAANIMSDEIRDMPGTSDSNPRQCGDASNRLSPIPHNGPRERARRTINAVSAALIMEQSGEDDADYEARLRRNYAYLFQPSEKWEDLNDLIEDGNDDVNGLGGSWDESSSDMFAHRNSMQAFEARYNSDDDFKQMVDAKVAEIQTRHETWLAGKLNTVCNSSPEQIMAMSPAIFDQFLVDMNDDDRAVASHYLCQQNFYYDAGEFDSDCDGENDDEDPAPSDPFNPDRDYDIDDGIYNNPPFSDSTTYEMSRGQGSMQNVVTVRTDLTFDFDSTVTDTEKAEYLTFVRGCAADLETALETGAAAWASGRPGFDGKTFNFDLRLSEAPWYDSGSFDVHRCWCSTCRVRSDDGWVYDTYIPQSRCRSDFSEDEVAALSDSELNPNRRPNAESNWWSQADAGNLIVTNRNPASDCRTIKHEIMHKLGLPDEYTAEYYPFNLVGENDSIMRSGHQIYDRHFGSLFSPRQCTMENGNRIL